MLLSENLLPLAIKFTKLANILQSIPFKWNPNTECFTMLTSSRETFGFWVGFIIGLTHMLVVTVLGLVNRNSSHLSIVIALFFIVGEWGCFYCQYTHVKHKNSIVNLLNNMIAFEREHNQELWKAKDLKQAGAPQLMNQFTSSALIMPSFMVILYWMGPCLSVSVGSVILEECKDYHGVLGSNSNSNSTFACIFKIGLVFYNAKLYSYIVSGALYLFQNGIFLKTYCFIRYFQLFERKIANRANSRRDIEIHAGLYRVLQLMATLFNDIYQKYCIVTVLMFQTIIQIIGFCTVVKLSSKISPAISVLFSVAASNAVAVILILFGSAAHVYSTSKGVTGRMKRIPKMVQSKWWQRYCWSCPVVKIRFGGTNYIDELAPLNFMDFNINQSVTLLLTM